MSLFSHHLLNLTVSFADFDAVRRGSMVDFIKKTTCNSVDLQKDQQYLIAGSSGLEVVHNKAYR